MARRLDDWLQSYLEYTRFSESPDIFHFFVGVSVLGGALRRKVWFDMGYFNFSPNFYTILTAPSGVVAKSTTMRLGMKLLKQIPDVTIGPNHLTWQSLPGALNTAAIARPQANGDLITESCITFAASEFGTFLDPKDEGLLNILIDLYDGQEPDWSKVTKGKGKEEVFNPWINLIAATTPSWIAENFGDYFVRGGFTSRCLFIYADKKRLLDAFPGDTIANEMGTDKFRALEKDLVEDLKEIAMLSGTYTLSPEAKKLATEWYETTHTSKELRAKLSSFDGYLNRRQAHSLKLSMVLTAARSPSLIIEEWAMRAAIELLARIEEDMPKVLGRIEQGANAHYVDAFLAYFDAQEEIPQEALYGLFLRRFGMLRKDFVALYDSLIAANMIERFEKEGIFLVRRKKPN